MPTESSIMFNSDYFVVDVSCMEILAEPLCGRRSQSGAPRVRKFGNLSIREILVLTSAYARTPVHPYRLWRRGRGVPRQPDRGKIMPSFLGGKLCGAFGQPAFFLAGNRIIIVAFEKRFFLKVKLIKQNYCSRELKFYA